LYGHLNKDLGLVLMLQIFNPIPSFIILMYLRCSIIGRKAGGKERVERGREGERARERASKREKDKTQTKTSKLRKEYQK
jgi:hypothetical protein